MKYLRIIFLCIGSIVLWNCCELNKRNIEIEEVAMSDNCFTDTFTYQIISYFPDGNVSRIIHVKDMKLNGKWMEYYGDGTGRKYYTFKDDILVIPEIREVFPKILFEHDSLKVGVETRLRVFGLYPYEEFGSSLENNMKKLYDDPFFDYSITPENIDTAYFYYRIIEKVSDASSLSKEEAASIIKDKEGDFIQRNIFIDKEPVCPPLTNKAPFNGVTNTAGRDEE